jgi:hypothetical protein
MMVPEHLKPYGPPRSLNSKQNPCRSHDRARVLAACARNAVEFPAFACTQATERLTAPSTLDEIQTFNHGTSERGRERDS